MSWDLLSRASKLPFPTRNDETAAWLHSKNEKTSPLSLAIKTGKRLGLLHLLREARWHRQQILPSHQRILVLHVSNHLGDSLMRLSAVQLLKDRHIDLYASSVATQVFLENDLFQNVYTMPENESSVQANDYDLIILDSLHSMPLKIKHRLFPTTPFVTMHDFFHYCRHDYNFTLFAWYRFAHLLGLSTKKIEERARLYLRLPESIQQTTPTLPPNSIGVVLGGREAYRTYDRWPEFLKLLWQHRKDQSVVLLGSENGREMSQKIEKECKGAPLINAVGQSSLLQSAALMKTCRCVILADGGLLHIANALHIPTLTLFAEVPPRFRYTAADRYLALETPVQVNDIAPSHIWEALHSFMPA